MKQYPLTSVLSLLLSLLLLIQTPAVAAGGAGLLTPPPATTLEETKEEAEAVSAEKESYPESAEAEKREEEEYFYYEVPIISTTSDQESLLFLGQGDTFYLSVEDVAELTRCTPEYFADRIVLHRGAETHSVKEDGSGDIPCMYYDGTCWCEAVPAVDCLYGTFSIVEDVPCLIYSMPETTIGEVLMPNLYDYTYSVEEIYGSTTGMTVVTVCDYLASLLNPFDDKNITSNEKDFQKDAILAVLGVDVADWDSVARYEKDKNRILYESLRNGDIEKILLDANKDAYDSGLGIMQALMDGVDAKNIRQYYSSVAHAKAGDYNKWYEDIKELENRFFTEYQPKKEDLQDVSKPSGYLDAAFLALDIGLSTKQMLSYGEDAQDLFQNVFDQNLLDYLERKEKFYWQDTALSVSREINRSASGILVQEAFEGVQDFLKKQGLDNAGAAAGYLVAGTAGQIGLFASKLSGIVTGLMFHKDFEAYASDLNAGYIRDFQQDTLSLLNALAVKTGERSWPTLEEQYYLKAILSLYYREVIAFSENMKKSADSFGGSEDWIRTLEEGAELAAYYLYRVTEWEPIPEPFYEDFEDDLLTEEWMEPFKLEVYNNGGEVVRYKDKTFYWRYQPESLSETGVFAYFGVDPEVENTLVMREENGEETELTKAACSGPLYILNHRLYYCDASDNWYSMTLEGEDEKWEGHFHLLLVDEATGSLVYERYGEGSSYICVQDKDGNVYDLFPAYDSENSTYGGALDCGKGYVFAYLYDYESLIMTVYRHNLRNHQDERIGELGFDTMEFTTGMVFTGKVFGNRLYVSGLTVQGTGMFYYNGEIHAITLDGSEQWLLVRADGDTAQMYDDFYFVAEDGQNYLYYYAGEGTDAISAKFQPWFDEGVRRIPLSDLDLTFLYDTTDPWIAEGSYRLENGNIQVRPNPRSAEIVTAVTADQLASYGIPSLNAVGEERSWFLSRFDVVKDKVYFEVTEQVQDDESSVGWRQGYLRENSSFFEADLKTGELKLIYTY